MKKNKLNPELLKEELKKFRLLSEYDFYGKTTEDSEYEKPLVLGAELEEADEEEATDAIAADLGLDAEQPAADAEQPATDETGDDEQTGEIPNEEPATDEVPAEEPVEEPVEDTSDDVEIDVTSLVKGSEDAKAAADKATANTEVLLQKLSDLESRVASMDNITNKIEGLEQEIIKRNPTPVEKLEMRSLSSFPYSQKLTDYWAEKEGAYDVMGNGDKKEEYVLTKDDVDYDYSEPEVKRSFGVKPDDYEEEEI
jgi:hypothetical protein